jgi:hypothetical protein
MESIYNSAKNHKEKKMFANKAAKLILFAVIVLPVLFTSACSSSTPIVVQNTQAAPAAVALAPTTPPAMPTLAPTPAPTDLPASPTVAPTVPPPTPTTPPPTPTSAPQADQMTAWCMPEGYFPVSATTDPTSMPKIAKTGSVVNGALSFQVPFSSCTFVYTFGQAKPAGTTLEIYDNNPAPWLKVPLTASSSNPNVMYAVIKHTYIINPPLWTTTYQFVVRTPDGTKVKTDPLTFHRYAPALCWNGLLPNPKTLTCQKQEDIHPWDASYPKKYYNCFDPTCIK